MSLKTGDVVIFRPINEVVKKHGNPNEDGWIKVGSQYYSEDMYNRYKDNIYSILKIEGDRVLFFNNIQVWEKITVGMIKQVRKIKKGHICE